MTSLITSGPKRSLVHVYPDVQNEIESDLYALQQSIDYTIEKSPDLVVFLGDLTNNNLADEWVRVSSQIARLTGAGLKWLVVPGNHDLDSPSRSTLMNSYLAPGAWVTGLMTAGHLENSYSIVSLEGVDWVVICLEFGPRAATVAWAMSVLNLHPTKPAIIVTHAYLYRDGTRYDWAAKDGSQQWSPHAYAYTPAEGLSDGQDMWNAFVGSNPNVRIVMSGHDFSAATGMAQASRLDGPCFQFLANFQEYHKYGGGVVVEVSLDQSNKQLYYQIMDTVNRAPLVTSASQFALTSFL